MGYTKNTRRVKKKKHKAPYYHCQYCGCTERIKCVDPETGKECEFVETNLCSFCHENNTEAKKNNRKIFNEEYYKVMKEKNNLKTKQHASS
jgi:hypothetical protein